jgi:hypothetical protein
MNGELRFTNTSNVFAVGVNPTAGHVVINRSTQGTITRGEALNLAAWIVALVDADAVEFRQLLKAIRET